MEPEDLSPEEQLKAENEVLKLKLELDHGMKNADTSALSPEAENSWLNHVYSFEQQYKNAKRLKVYDAIGRPSFKKREELSEEEVPIALKEILSIMEEKGVELDCCCPYEETVIYKFITEELFDHEMDDISIEGMVHHFSYEEFYPNHDYDLRRYSEEFIENLLTRKWDPEFNNYSLGVAVSYHGKEYDNTEISAIILTFQEDRTFQIEAFEITQVSFDVEKGEGMVQGHLTYQLYARQENQFHQGDLVLHFTYDLGYWYLSGFQVPGF